MYQQQRVRRCLALFGVCCGAAMAAHFGVPAAAAANEVQITVVAYVDVAPATDPDCPGCDGEFTAEDQDFAQDNALPPMTFVVRDGDGTELGRAETSELTVGIQRTLFTLPASAAFVVELTAVPPDWQLCARDALARTLTPGDFAFGTARAEYHFTRGCSAPARPAVIQAATTATALPTATAAPSAAAKTTAAATTDAGPQRLGSAGRAGSSDTGSIKGFACIDADADGQVDGTDPGLADVQVRLGGPRGTIIQRTPPDGSFSFDYLAPGRYEVSVAPGASWRLTTPDRYVVVLASGQEELGNDFCMVRADEAAAPAVEAGRGVRLPDTGSIALPLAPLLVVAALLLAALGGLGFATERRRHGRV